MSIRVCIHGEREAKLLSASVLQAANLAKDVDKFNEQRLQYKGEIESGNPVADHQKAYDDFFIQKTTPKRGLQVFFIRETVSRNISRYASFQTLLSNGIKNPVEAMRVYRDKNVVEKCFDDL